MNIPPALTQKRIQSVLKEKSCRLPHHRHGQEFLCGPIPLDWLQAAAAFPGKTLAVGIALWFKAGATKCRVVQAPGRLLRKFGVSRKAGYGGLKNLEAAGLVEVKRHAGCCPEVTILALDKSENKCKNIT